MNKIFKEQKKMYFLRNQFNSSKNIFRNLTLRTTKYD